MNIEKLLAEIQKFKEENGRDPIGIIVSWQAAEWMWKVNSEHMSSPLQKPYYAFGLRFFSSNSVDEKEVILF